jgi:TPR repeat protein
MNNTKDRLRKKLAKQQQQETVSIIENFGEAVALLEKAKRLYNANQYTDAFNTFKTCYDLYQSTQIMDESNITFLNTLLDSMSRCQEMLGNDIQAEELLNEAYKQNRKETETLLLEFYQRKGNIEKIYQLLKNRDPEYLLKVCGIELLYKIANHVYINKKHPTSQKHALHYCKRVVTAAETGDQKSSREKLLDYKKTLANIYLSQKNYQACYETYRDMTKLSTGYHQVLARIVCEHGVEIVRPATETEFYWQKLSYEHKNPRGAFDYAFMLTEGGTDFKIDHKKAAAIFTDLAATRHPNAAHELAIIYTKGGYGVDRNTDLAIKYYRQSIDEFDSIISKNNLGILLFNLNRFEEALELLQEAADQDLDKAQVCLGIIYNYGFGVEKNAGIAFIWYLRALKNGNSIALCNLIVLVAEIIVITDQEELKQVKLLCEQIEMALHKAIKAGNPSLQKIAPYFELLKKLQEFRSEQLATLAHEATSTINNEIEDAPPSITPTTEQEQSTSEQLAKLKHKNPSTINREFQDVRSNLNLTAEQQVKMICTALAVSNVQPVSLSNAILHIGQIINKSNDHPTNKNITPDIATLLRSLIASLAGSNETNLGWLPPALTGLGLLQWQNTNNMVDELQDSISLAIQKNSTQIKLVTACMLFVGFSRLKLTDKAKVSVDVLAKRIEPNLSKLDLRQLGNIFFASAVMSCNGMKFDFILAILQEITLRIRTRNIAYLDPIFANQTFLAARYFSRSHTKETIEIIRLLTPIVTQNMEVEANKNIADMSYFQRKFTRFLRAYCPELKVEQIINGLIVDVVLPNGVVVQINGPKHYLHDVDSRLPPTTTPIENFHNALLANQTVVHVPYFEADSLSSPAEIYAYLNSKLPADKKLPPFDPKKHQPAQTRFGLSSSNTSVATNSDAVDDDDVVENEDLGCTY